MEIIKFRHMRNLPGRKIAVLIACLIFIQLSLDAQTRGNHNYLDFQKKPYYFGLSLGVNSTGYKVNHSSDFINNDSVYIAEGNSGSGLNLHMIANLKIGNYFDFRVSPGFSFAERTFMFTKPELGEKPVERKLESVFLDVPFVLRFKSKPYHDMRLYVLAGLKYSYDVASNAKSRKSESLVKISPHDFQYEFGAGMQFFFPFFIFSPEIKISRGLGNILIYNHDLNDSRILENVSSSIVTISFQFEG